MEIEIAKRVTNSVWNRENHPVEGRTDSRWTVKRTNTKDESQHCPTF